MVVNKRGEAMMSSKSASRAEAAAPWLVLLGGIAGVLPWFVGVYLVLRSPNWPRSAKMYALLLPPFGAAVPLSMLGLADSQKGTHCVDQFGSSGQLIKHYCTGHTQNTLPLLIAIVALFALSLFTFIQLKRTGTARLAIK
jgi:ABC-type branched-subunit amino acid transport system permease subunit